MAMDGVWVDQLGMPFDVDLDDEKGELNARCSRSSAPRRHQAAADLLWAAGPGALDDDELLATVLGGARARCASGAARAVLTRVGGLSALARAGPGALVQVPGIGRARAARLVACAELARRLRTRAGRSPPRLATPASVAAYLAPRADSLEVEQLWVLSLDGRNGLRGVRCVARGGSHGCAVTAREILRCALGDAASAIVLAHNHPSGDPTPSAEDAAMTRAVAHAAEVVGVPVLDHVVVTASGSYASLLERGLL